MNHGKGGADSTNPFVFGKTGSKKEKKKGRKISKRGDLSAKKRTKERTGGGTEKGPYCSVKRKDRGGNGEKDLGGGGNMQQKGEPVPKGKEKRLT